MIAWHTKLTTKKGEASFIEKSPLEIHRTSARSNFPPLPSFFFSLKSTSRSFKSTLLSLPNKTSLSNIPSAFTLSVVKTRIRGSQLTKVLDEVFVQRLRGGKRRGYLFSKLKKSCTTNPRQSVGQRWKAIKGSKEKLVKVDLLLKPLHLTMETPEKIMECYFHPRHKKETGVEKGIDATASKTSIHCSSYKKKKQVKI